MKQDRLCTVIVNPTAGRERAPKYIPLLHTTLAKRFDDITIKLTEKAGDATEFARIAAEKGRDVICMGGDGTINDQYFINVVAAGLISEAVSQVTIKEKTLFGSLAYFMKGMQVLNKQKSYHFTIEDENGTMIQVSSPLIAAMLTDSAGSFRNLIPPEDRNKGIIKLCLFHDFAWMNALRQAPKLLAGFQMGPDFVTVVGIKKAHISIKEDDTLWTNVDGDKGPKFPIDLEILPSRLPVFVPPHIDDTATHLPHFFEKVAPHMHFPWNENDDITGTTIEEVVKQVQEKEAKNKKQ